PHLCSATQSGPGSLPGRRGAGRAGPGEAPLARLYTPVRPCSDLLTLRPRPAPLHSGAPRTWAAAPAAGRGTFPAVAQGGNLLGRERGGRCGGPSPKGPGPRPGDGGRATHAPDGVRTVRPPAAVSPPAEAVASRGGRVRSWWAAAAGRQGWT